MTVQEKIDADIAAHQTAIDILKAEAIDLGPWLSIDKASFDLLVEKISKYL